MKKTQTKMILSVAAILMLGISAFAQADNTPKQAGPTLEETIDFLKGKINGSTVTIQEPSRFDWREANQTYTYKITSTKGAELILEEKYFRKITSYLDNGKILESTSDCSSEVSIPLKEIVPDSIKVAEWEGNFAVRMKAFVNKKIKVDKVCTSSSSTMPDKSAKTEKEAFGIVFSSKETAEKVAKALAHAAKLSGAKEELF